MYFTHFAIKTIANALNSLMCAEDRTVSLNATVHYCYVQPCSLLRSYPEVACYLLKKNATNAAIAEYDAPKMRSVQPAQMTPNNLQAN